MKIVFLCGSLESGRDGVGDYTRRLVGEMIRQGHQAAAVALNDGHIVEEFTGTQHAGCTCFPVLRVPSNRLAKDRFSLIKEWIDEFEPEWLSLQFVSFSFHPKGLPFRLSKQLASLGEGRQWHIMFHELWVAMDATTPKKHLFLGNIQRQLIKHLIKRLNPVVIHTQTRLYQTQLMKLGFAAGILPLFSNIPMIQLSDSEMDTVPKKKSPFNFVVFGSIHPNALINQFAKEVALHAQKYDAQASLTIIGRSGPEQKRWASVWESEGMPVNLLGEQSPECISEILSQASIGLSSTPFVLMEKSGSVAAMREHGLPVLCIAEPWCPAGFMPESYSGVFEYDSMDFEIFLSKNQNLSANNIVSSVAAQLADDLMLAV